MSRTRFLLLIIDPQVEVAARLHERLLDLPIDVIVTADAADGLLQAGALRPDAVLVAADVASLGGESVARVLRRRTGIPALVGVDRTDKDHVQPVVAAGAFAAVARPYRASEILTILRSVSPGTPVDLAPSLDVGRLRLDPVARQVTLRGRQVRLRMREFELLHLLMLHAGRVLSRRQIFHLVWNEGDETSNTLSVHIKRLRERLGDDPRDPRLIVSVRGVGYRLDPPD